MSQPEKDLERDESRPLNLEKAVSSYSSAEPKQNSSEQHSDALLQPSSDGFPQLDMTRIICVCLVAVDHGNKAYAEWNAIFVQQWTMQWIVLVSGICYALSKKSLSSYCFRLGTYVVIGVLVNLSAWMALNMDWRNNMFNVVFQMWFVVGLMVYAAILAPLKALLALQSQERLEPALPRDSPSHHSWSTGLMTVAAGLMLLAIFFHYVLPVLVEPIAAPAFLGLSKLLGAGQETWGLPETMTEADLFVANLSCYSYLTMSNLYLMFTLRLSTVKVSLIPWVIIANSFVHRSLFYRGPEERPFHFLDLMILGLATYHYGIRHRKIVGDYVVRYWFVILISFAIIWPPYMDNRMDMNPTHERILRTRCEIIEAVSIIAWLCAGDRMFSREIFTVDKLGWLNDWALLLFLVHKASHMLLGQPTSWLFLAMLLPVVYFLRRS
mmetsp:Transcript_97154/g.173051  ORF Transcript_97154/g.173051 Transcript_97154/m.173051 type:complete len:438 (-) Transcript_97154:89-1402(-)